ncbi:MAG: FG-GAP-like repeat-containing protein, partial [Bacteroidetes bacterium]|nr:FG-GAP-like repeat-containing protein [Bacteroidota bacterium]
MHLRTLHTTILGLWLLCLVLLFQTALFAQPSVTSTFPAPNAIRVPGNVTIAVTFSEDIDAATLTRTALRVFGSLSGLRSSAIHYDSSSRSATINPAAFSAGEMVEVVATTGIKNLSGQPLSVPLTWRFTVAGKRASASFKGTSVPVGGQLPYGIVAGDFDRDGDLDLASTTYNARKTVSILRNNGYGTFTQSSFVNAGTQPYHLVTADLDGDGDLDLAVANRDSSCVSIIKNSGTGTFARSSLVTVGTDPVALTTGDFDADGDIDIASCNSSANSVSILLNDGSGTFVQSSAITELGQLWSIASNDLDGDGDIDLAVTDLYAKNVTLLMNSGAGGFAAETRLSASQHPVSVTTGDYDGDHDIDIAVAQYFGEATSLTVFRNDGGGVFAPTTFDNAGSNPRSIWSGDYDGDGDLDISLVNYNSDNVSIHLNDGNGSFTQGVSLGTGIWPNGFATGDLDGDGDLDLAVSNVNSSTVTVVKSIPAAPARLTITDSSSHTLVLRWRRNIEGTFTRYRIYRDTVPHPVVQVDSSSLSRYDTVCVMTGLPNGIRQYVRITAVDNGGNESASSIEVSAVPRDIIPPSAPKSIAVVTQAHPAASDSVRAGVMDTVMTLAGLEYRTRYFFRVTAVDEDSNESAFSTEVEATTGDYIAPAPPREPTVIDSSSRTIVLRWQRSEEEDFSRYRISWGTEKHLTMLVDSVMGRTDTILTFRWLIDGIRYRFRITSVDTAGNESGFSEEVDAVPADRIPPAIPKSPSIVDSSSRTITLVWKKNTDSDLFLYRIYRGVQPDPVVQIDSVYCRGIDTVRTYRGLMNGKRYYFRVTAIDSVGNESGFSAQVHAVPWDRIAPAAPKQLFIADSLGHRVILGWRKNGDLDLLRYRIYRATAPNPAVCVDSTSGRATDTIRIYTGLAVGTRYYFRVAAVDSCGNESPHSNEVNVTPNTTVQFLDGAEYAPASARMNTLNNPVGRFRLKAARPGVTLTSVNITFFGTFDGVRAVKLWSSADSIFGGDARRDSVAFLGGPVLLRGTS